METTPPRLNHNGLLTKGLAGHLFNEFLMSSLSSFNEFDVNLTVDIPNKSNLHELELIIFKIKST